MGRASAGVDRSGYGICGWAAGSPSRAQALDPDSRLFRVRSTVAEEARVRVMAGEFVCPIFERGCPLGAGPPGPEREPPEKRYIKRFLTPFFGRGGGFWF